MHYLYFLWYQTAKERCDKKERHGKYVNCHISVIWIYDIMCMTCLQVRGRLKRCTFAKELNVNLKARFLHSALTVIKLYVLLHILRGSIPMNSPFYEFPERTSASRLSTSSFTKCSCKTPSSFDTGNANKNKLWCFDYVIISTIMRKLLHWD